MILVNFGQSFCELWPQGSMKSEWEPLVEVVQPQEDNPLSTPAVGPADTKWVIAFLGDQEK